MWYLGTSAEVKEEKRDLPIRQMDWTLLLAEMGLSQQRFRQLLTPTQLSNYNSMPSDSIPASFRQGGQNMTKFKQMLVATAMPAMLFTGLAASTEPASAIVYCTYVGYPAACVVRPGVRLVARPVGVGVGRVGHVGGAHVGNRNGGVNRVGVRR
jgi:hypothetical protein